MRNRPVVTLSEDEAALARRIVLADAPDLIAFDKPAGLPCQTRSTEDLTLDRLLWAFARSNGKRPHLVHRLDAGTSGVVIAAKTRPAAASLSEAFAARRVRKTYLALVTGAVPDAEAGEIDHRLLRYSPRPGLTLMRVARANAGGAETALTRWCILARAGQAALMQLTPETGRMHQLRVHMAALGCPIAGDPVYGTGPLSAPRLMLHAMRLVLPGEAAPRTFEAGVPEDFAAALAAAGLPAAGDLL